MRSVYLDNAATTPMRREVLEAMLPYLSGDKWGNPSSSHGYGRRARAGVDHAREQIAGAIGVQPSHVIFTSGGTEADNLAILGAALAARERGGPFHVAISGLEHPAVHEAAATVKRMGGRVTVLPVDRRGVVSLSALDRVLETGVALVSVMWVSNEVGVVQDIPRLAERVAAAGVLFHTDAVQAVAKIPCSISDVPCDLYTISGHKIGGPQGAGALLMRDRRMLEGLVHGGGQQFGVRPGTENVAGYVGLGTAVALGVAEVDGVGPALGKLRDRFERGLGDCIPDAQITAADGHRAPHVSHVTIPGIDSQAMQMHLDLAGVACSGGSACHTGVVEPSTTVLALGVPPDLAARALRFSFYRQNTAADVDTALEILPGVVDKVRSLTAALGRNESVGRSVGPSASAGQE